MSSNESAEESKKVKEFMEKYYSCQMHNAEVKNIPFGIKLRKITIFSDFIEYLISNNYTCFYSKDGWFNIYKKYKS